jgi:hypothetical protein
LLTYLAGHDEEGAKTALAAIKFPTEGPAYYYAQAAWNFAHDNKSEGQNWVDKAQKVHPVETTAWFTQHIYKMGWSKKQPTLLPQPN